MSLKLKKNIQPSMPVCHMLCDDGLDPKLNMYEITSYMNQHATNLLIGKPKSGKTSMLTPYLSKKNSLPRYFIIFIFFNRRRPEQV